MKTIIYCLWILLLTASISKADQAQADKWYEEINGDATCSDYDNYRPSHYVSCFLAERRAERFGQNFDTPLKMARVTDRAIEGIIKIAAWNLWSKGFHDESDELEQEMVFHEGEIERIISRKGYDTKDFAP